MIKNFILVCLAVYAAEANPIAPKGLVPSEYGITLDGIIEHHYYILLNITEETLNGNLEFKGIVDITIGVNKTMDNIKLHSKVKSIESVKLFLNNEHKKILIDKESPFPNPNPDTDIYTITPKTFPIEEDNTYIIQIEYTGQLSTTDKYGFYRSSYKNNNGKDVYLATTQFQPSYARRAFPCFDDPSVKALFDITIVHPSRLNALGNTEEAEKTIDKNIGMTTTSFAQTPHMSTDLVAFIITDLTCDENTEKLASGMSHLVCS